MIYQYFNEIKNRKKVRIYHNLLEKLSTLLLIIQTNHKLMEDERRETRVLYMPTTDLWALVWRIVWETPN